MGWKYINDFKYYYCFAGFPKPSFVFEPEKVQIDFPPPTPPQFVIFWTPCTMWPFSKLFKKSNFIYKTKTSIWIIIFSDFQCVIKKTFHDIFNIRKHILRRLRYLYITFSSCQGPIHSHSLKWILIELVQLS